MVGTDRTAMFIIQQLYIYCHKLAKLILKVFTSWAWAVLLVEPVATVVVAIATKSDGNALTAGTFELTDGAF